MTSRNYWLIIQRIENFEKSMELNFKVTGFPERKKNFLSKIKVGDIFIIYIASRKSVIGGILKVKKSYYIKDDLIWDDLFNIRIDTEPYIILKENQMIPFKKLVKNLSFVKNKKNWKNYVMHSIKMIPYKDYLLIEKNIKKVL